MAPQFRDLVGRAMVDLDFLADLQRSPEAVLDQYDLSDAERATVHQALRRLAEAPSHQRTDTLRTALLRRVAT